MTLTRRQIKTLVELLSLLQDGLESAIETATLPDGSFDKHATRELKQDIARDRLAWRRAEDMIASLELLVDEIPRLKAKRSR